MASTDITSSNVGMEIIRACWRLQAIDAEGLSLEGL